MASLTTRISKQTHSTLRELAKNTGQPMQSILDKAVDEYHRRQFWRQVRQSYAALRKDPRAWKEELDERSLWENTLADGLEDD